MLPFMQNPYEMGVKKNLFEIIKERYQSNEDIIDKISELIKNEKDYQKFFKLITDIYETAYIKSVNEHKTILEKQGLRVNITKPDIKKDGPKIFKD